MTAVEKIILEIDNELQTLEGLYGKEIFGRKVGLAFAKRVAEQAKEMEKHEKIKFALNVCIERAQTHGGDALEIAKKLANL